MPIAGPESHPHYRKNDLQQRTPAGDPIHSMGRVDPMDALIATMREEFQRGLVRQAAQLKAARRRRILASIFTLLALAGIGGAAALLRGAIHLQR